ncbi:MAG TPA: N-methyl-L-tryptophan oxidase [Acidimicrobiia bacterium]|nr:N-methyl-L-tryptophan oxidase [Acidimicrobiia bacterium]
MAETYDVIVVGLGGMGSAAAYHLARRGRRVLGFERFIAAHDRGSSHGSSRLIRQAYFEDPAYVPLVLRAYELWRELEAAADTELLLITGLLIIGGPDSEIVAGSLRSARQWGLEHEVLDAADLVRRFPTFAPDPDNTALYEPQAGVLRPEAAVAAHLRLAAEAGADLRFSTPIVAWEADPSDEGVTVTTVGGVVRADRLIVSPGAWAPDVLADLGVPLQTERHVQFWIQPDGGLDPFLPDRHPAWLWDGGPGDGLPYSIPAVDGPDGGVKVSWHRMGRPCHPDDLDRTVSPAEVEAIAEAVRARVPALAGRFLRAAPCMYTNTPDEHFVVGPHPGHPQVLVAAGFCGHGFKFAPVIGEIVADLVIDGTTAHPIGLFDPGRFS